MDAYHRPDTLDEALDLMAAGPLVVAAGCTDLYPATNAPALPGDVLDITGIETLNGIRENAGWQIGATLNWTGLTRAELPSAFDGLKQAAREIGSVQIQNAGTVAGNLCTASPAGDSIPPLLTLDAEIEIRKARGQRLLPLSEFLTGARRTALEPGELVTAIHIPAAAGRGVSRFLKLGARHSLVISIAMVAVRLELDGDRIARAAVAVGACSPVAVRLPELETALAGARMKDALHLVERHHVAPHLAPIDDIRADAGYRITAATELVRRCMADALGPMAMAA